MNQAELMRCTFEMFRPPRLQSVSEWADENRVLTSDSSAEAGRWRTDRAPYQREIMDAFTQIGVEQIVLMASAQVGKSEIELNMIGRAIDLDPGPIMYVQPSQETAEDYSKRRIAPMIEACPTLREKVSRVKARDSGNTIKMKSFVGGSISIASANAPSELRSKPIRYLFLDEIDAFPASSGTEGDPVKLAMQRTETYPDRKIVMTSTPTLKRTSKIEKEYMKGTQEEWRTECPHCRQYSYIRFDDVIFDKEEFKDEQGDTNWIVRNSRWRCPICKRETPEHDAKRLNARWVAVNEKALENGIRSFRLNAFMSPWSSWNDIALTFLQAKDDPNLLQTFHNLKLGESWEMNYGTTAPEILYERREHYNAEVPSGVLVLTMGIDTQDNRLEYEVVGWDRNEQSWGISRGVIPGRADSPAVWDEVDELLDRGWQMKNGKCLRVLATFIDSGGHFTQEVYRECAKRSTRHIWPIKGEGGQGKPYVRQMKNIGVRGLVGFIIGVDNGKEAIMYSCGLDKEGAKYMHFPLEYKCGYDLEFFRGLISERQVFHRKMGQTVIAWEKTHERNEPLDCRNYARAAYKYFNWNFDKCEEAIEGREKREIVTQSAVEKRAKKRVISGGIKI